MKFGPVPVGEAAGATLAHSLVLDGARLRKGRVLTADDLAMIEAHGVREVVVARLEDGDEDENSAAARIGACLVTGGLALSPVATGRANIVAGAAGVLRVDAGAVGRLNAIDEGLTLATVPDLSRVAADELVATVKIMPYALPKAVVDAGVAALTAPPMRLHAFRGGTARLIMTRTPGFKESLLTKGEAAVGKRLERIGYALEAVCTVPHVEDEIAAALAAGRADLTLILGASATSDRHDVAPAGVVAAGGRIERFGMPVDPGNLLFIGAMGDGSAVIGLPGCARSPALNGVDWVLERLSAGIAVTGRDIAAMGVGGLLKETPDRPQPRQF